MCNLYSLDKGQDAIRKAFEVDRDETGNLPPLPSIFPDQMAPVVRLADGERELAMMRWGFPSPVNKGPQHPVINVRNMKSPYW
jgi:putative SOS response-associated peptidase YedK